MQFTLFIATLVACLTVFVSAAPVPSIAMALEAREILPREASPVIVAREPQESSSICLKTQCPRDIPRREASPVVVAREPQESSAICLKNQCARDIAGEPSPVVVASEPSPVVVAREPQDGPAICLKTQCP